MAGAVNMAGARSGAPMEDRIVPTDGPEKRPSPIDRLRSWLKGDEGSGRSELTDFDRKVKPREKYVFHSDYFEVDEGVSCVLAFRPVPGDARHPFWQISMLPPGVLPAGVRSVNYSHVRRKSQTWVDQHRQSAEDVADRNAWSQEEDGSQKTKSAARRDLEDVAVVGGELDRGAAYLHVQDRLQLFAPDLETLDLAVERVEAHYKKELKLLKAGPFHGQQRKELCDLYGPIERKQGEGLYYTSTEYAGAYSYLTNGLNDDGGLYVGWLANEVNNSGVLFDMDRWEGHVVVADGRLDPAPARRTERISDEWGAKVASSALLGGHRVVEIVLNGYDPDRILPPAPNVTRRVDMRRGDVNMFEMFGDRADSEAIYAKQVRKVSRMAEQAYDCTEEERGAIRSWLEDVLNEFYVENHMWVENAKDNREQLRVVGVPHEQVPTLDMFCLYLDRAYQRQSRAKARDDRRLHALGAMRATFRNMLDANGDVFGRTTNPAVDDVARARRAIYEFSGLAERGVGIAMAQLVNVLGFAVSTLGPGDVVAIHGAERIADDAELKRYIKEECRAFTRRGGRVCWCYDDVGDCFDDEGLCGLSRADYLILGTMSAKEADRFVKILGSEVPTALRSELCEGGAEESIIRRGHDNVVFVRDIL